MVRTRISCHSGTATRGHADDTLTVDENIAKFGVPEPKFRALSRNKVNKIYMRSRDLYDGIQLELPRVLPKSEACIVLLSGCQDRQLSGEVMGHGLFTQALIDTWAEGAFSRPYANLRSKILLTMPDDQSPQMEVIGTKIPEFIEGEKPFTIDP